MFLASTPLIFDRACAQSWTSLTIPRVMLIARPSTDHFESTSELLSHSPPARSIRYSLGTTFSEPSGRSISEKYQNDLLRKFCFVSWVQQDAICTHLQASVAEDVVRKQQPTWTFVPGGMKAEDGERSIDARSPLLVRQHAWHGVPFVSLPLDCTPVSACASTLFQDLISIRP